jgi:hypothetical protein
LPEFSVQFDPAPFEALDQLALLARQDYNLGGAGDWFGEFRGGLYGFYARLYGVQRHYFEVHAWLPRVRIPTETEYHLASILFHMDSALECITFALNALGWIAMPAGFRDLTDAKALKRITPFDILGDATRTAPIAHLSGYQKVFPTVQGAWQNEAQLIAQVRDLHDVSKHRRTIYVGGQGRLDPPDGFFEALGLPEDADRHGLLSPMAEVILMDDPKLPRVRRTPQAVRQGELLEDLVPSFAALIKTTGSAAIGDAPANVPLKENRLGG